MNGRDEHTLKVEKLTRNYIIHRPSLITEYYNSLAGKTAETKYNYIIKVCQVFDIIFGTKEWNNDDIVGCTTAQINSFISQKLLTVSDNEIIGTSAVATQVSIIKNFFDFLEKNGFILVNPVDKSAGRPKVVNKKPRVRLSDEEIDIIFKNIEDGVGSSKAINKQKHWKTMYKLMVGVLLTTGIRVEALVNINVSDIDFVKKVIVLVEKGNSLREVLLMPEVENIALKWIDERAEIMGDNIHDTEALFITRRNGFQRINRTTVNVLLKKFSKGIDKSISAHKFRHTAGTEVYQKSGGDLLLTQEFLGHASVNTTQIYAEHDKSKMAEVISQICKNQIKN